jgi:hypothetical protein
MVPPNAYAMKATIQGVPDGELLELAAEHIG